VKFSKYSQIFPQNLRVPLRKPQRTSALKKPKMSQLTIKTFIYPEAFTEMQTIRNKVFHEEQGVDPALEFDGLDHTAEHLLAYLDNQPVGTTRIRYLDSQTAKIERLAVLPSARGKGIGKKLMKKALEIAQQKPIQQIVVNSQEYVKGLYQQLGFEQLGEKFDEAGITHVKMIKKLR
jgi:predicted GNAT family N-acyltransferase